MTAVLKDTPSAQRWPVILLVLCHMNGAFSMSLLKFTPVGPVATAFWRLVLTLPVLIRANSLPPRAEWAIITLAGLMFGLDLALWYRALQQTTFVNATLLINLYPALVALLAWPLLNQRPSRRFWLGFALTVAGAAVIIGKPSGLTVGALGDLQAVGAAVVYAVYFVIVSRLSATYGASSALLWTNAAALPWLAVIAWGFGESLAIPMDWTVWSLFAIAFASIAGQWVFTYALARLPAAFAALTSHLGVPFAAIAGWLTWGQPIGIVHLIGGGLIIGGLTVARHRPLS
ncbi:DMT family transporter [Lacibacterium aquatile]|uniref:DMT family transporter n=1 Tax=Lacibacterium aquatile TaxID=1168082 RepID=A0ABW5DME7_9PROT